MTEKIIERIRKLLRMARDKGASEAEASLAMKMTSAVRNKVLEAYKELSKIQF